MNPETSYIETSSSLSSLSDSSPDESRLPNESNGCGQQSLYTVINSTSRQHPLSYHTTHLYLETYQLIPPIKGTQCLGCTCDVIDDETSLQTQLLKWYDQVKHNRDMPWRKDIQYSEGLTSLKRGQRAYEVGDVFQISFILYTIVNTNRAVLVA